MKKIGIVGCGVIGTELSKAIIKDYSDVAKITAVCDLDSAQISEFKKTIGIDPEVLDINAIVRKTDLIIEAASPKAAEELVPRVLEGNKEIMIVSTGGLIQIKNIFEKIKKGPGKIYFTTGAIAGLDGIRAARKGRIDSISLTTMKAPRSLAGADYIVEKGIDLDAIKKEEIIFEGTVFEAIKAFPKNINVCATIAMVSEMPDIVKVKIIVSPDIKRNIHTIDVKGDFGTIVCRSENKPSPVNPKTSYLAVLSSLDLLEKIIK